MTHNWVGQTLGGRYQIESLLGQGGMSAVYRGVDPNLRRMVAIKLIHPHLSVDPNFIFRFKEEAAAIARLRHPNIVQVHDFDLDGDTYYMVMEYLVGETLQARLKRLNSVGRRMSYAEALRIAGQLCDGLGYAHKHELIHRDIKPANIMLDVNGQAILMDFGIVKIIGGEYHTATGATLGTAMYMSPEQIRSERVDERADIYSLGVTLYEMVSGRVPYQADSVMTLMMMVLNDPLPNLREIRPNAPEQLVSIIEKALAKEQLDRYQSMEQMASVLEQVRMSLHAESEVVTEVDEGREGRPPPVPIPRSSTQIEEQPTEPERERISPPEPDQRSERDVSVPPIVDDLQVEPAVVDTPAPPRPAARRRLGKRTLIISALSLLLLGVIVVAAYLFIKSSRSPRLQIDRVSQPPAPITIQTAQFVVSLGAWDVDSYVDELDFSPDGMLLGTANNREDLRFSKHRYYAALWRMDSGTLKTYLLGPTAWVYSIDFSPDGRLFAAGADDASIRVWNVSDVGLVREIETSTGGITSLEFSPSNLLLAAGSWDGVVGLWQVGDGQLLRSFQDHEDSVRDVVFSPDGSLLASASDDSTVILWRVSDGSFLHGLRGHSASVVKIAFSPDGTLLASASEDGTLRLWGVGNGSHQLTLQGHSEAVYDLDFSPDGSLVASGSGDSTLRVWRVTDGELLGMLGEHDDSINSVAFSPDGRLLVSAASDGVLHFWGLSEAIPLETEVTAP